MSRFYGSLKGHRGEASRPGTAKSGLEGHIRGWHIGARVFVSVGSEDQDMVTVYATSGSNQQANDVKIAELTEADFNNPGFINWSKIGWNSGDFNSLAPDHYNYRSD